MLETDETWEFEKQGASASEEANMDWMPIWCVGSHTQSHLKL